MSRGPNPFILSASEAIVAALFFISASLQLGGGVLTRPALASVTAGLVCCAWGLLSKKSRLRWPLPCAILAYEIYQLLTTLPPVDAAHAPLFHGAIGLASAAALAVCVLPQHRGRLLAFTAAVAGVFAAGILMLRGSPHPTIDVFDFHQKASAALISGSNPYAIRTRDIYIPEYSRKFYGPGISLGGRLTVGFPYPPISLYISCLGYLFAGDCRYAHLTAICLAALLLGFSRPSRISFMGALLFLFTPTVFLVLDAGWTEPVVVFLLAATVFCRDRYPAAAPWVTGLLLTGKQYMIFTAPPLLRKWRDVPRAALAATLLTAPLVLWNVREFFNSAVFFHFAQPTRADALSYMALLMRYGIRMPGWVPFALTAAAIVFVRRKAPVGTSGMCCGTALILIVFFAFNKAAFTNYYYLVIGCLAAAIATLKIPDSGGWRRSKNLPVREA